MKIEDPEIEGLYTFTRQHFVEHYDLQTELVDHLANDIENIWIKQPNLSFDKACDMAFKRFGIFGFMNVIEKRQKAMRKRYVNYLWTEFKQWFTLPKIVITICAFAISYVMFSPIYASLFLVISYGVVAVWCTIKSYQLNRQLKKRKEQSNKKWMLEKIIYRQAGGAGLILLSQLPTWYTISEDYFNNFAFILGVSVLTSVFIIYMYVSFELLPNKAEDLLNETYPEFNL